MAEDLEFVKKAFEVSNETAQVMMDSFGPNGLDTLVSTSSGTLIMTNDGFPVLKTLSSRCPVGKLLFQGVSLFYKSSGDFSKKFILLTGGMLSEILDIVSEHKSKSRGEILCIFHGMVELLESLSCIIFDQLQTKTIASECTGNIDDILNPAISILKTSISGKFSPKTSEVLVDLLKTLVLVGGGANDVRYLKETTVKLLENFSSIVWEASGKPFTSSAVLQGFIIPREFLTIVKKLPRLLERDSFKFVILGSSLGYDLPQSTTVLSLHDSRQVKSMLEWRRRYIENIVKKLAECNVELIITSATLHETFVHICNQYHIAVIHLIPQEDISRISDEFCINPLFELDDDLSSFIGEATSCRSIQVGLHAYVYLKSVKTATKQVILYAPSEELCHQYAIALKNMLKTLQSSFKEKPDKSQVLSYVPGGGAFELVLAFTLEEYRNLNVISPNMKLACQLLEKALLSIPRQLSKNSNCRLPIFNLMAKTRQALTCGEPMFILNKYGELSTGNTEGIVEPTMANFILVSSVLQLLIQILRTDKIVHVRTLPNKLFHVDDEDSDSEV